MGIETTFHPDVSSGPIGEFGFYKVERQTKTVINNMLDRFFSVRSKAFGVVIPEVLSVQNLPTNERTYIRRDFSMTERKFPMIVTSIKSTKEKKSFLGSDDLLYIDVETNPDGLKSASEVYAGMAEIEMSLIVVGTSPDERSKLAEMISICFTHFFRGHFIYKGDNGSMFSIVPASKPINFGTEAEITDDSKTTFVYVKDISISNTVEYQFRDFGAGERLTEVNSIDLGSGSGLIES